MYELEAGMARLVAALYNRKDDAPTIQRLAVLLDYMPEQLKEDVEALYDFYQLAGDEKAVDE